jgi:chromosomal replication initiation ATPase DnaA
MFLERQAPAVEAARDRAKAAFVTHLVALATGVSPEQIYSQERGRGRIPAARAMAMYLTHVGFGMPLQRVAAAFCRDRSTTAYACSRVEEMREERGLDQVLDGLEACVRQAPAEPAL